MTERTERGQFAKGCSGNKAGKPPGTRNRATVAAQELLDGQTAVLTQKAIAIALEGDTTALRLCLERLIPPVKERPIDGITLPPLGDSQGVLTALEQITHQLASGELLPGEAKALCHLIEKYHQAFEISVIAQRLEALEITLRGRK